MKAEVLIHIKGPHEATLSLLMKIMFPGERNDTPKLRIISEQKMLPVIKCCNIYILSALF